MSASPAGLQQKDLKQKVSLSTAIYLPAPLAAAPSSLSSAPPVWVAHTATVQCGSYTHRKAPSKISLPEGGAEKQQQTHCSYACID